MSTMTFGIGLMPTRALGEFGRIAALAETNGFDTVWVPDERFYRECYVSLTICAVHTRRVRLGTCVTDPYVRHPALTAAAIGSVDEASGGRVVLGLGAGATGLRALGISRDRPAVAIREAVALIRELWRGRAVTSEGKVIQFHGGQLEFQPRPDIPIFIAGRGPRILQLAGEIGDGVIIGALASPQALGYALREVRAGSQRVGRGQAPEVVLWVHTAIDRDVPRARSAVRGRVARVLISCLPFLNQMGITLPDGLGEEVARVPYGALEEAGLASKIPDAIVDHFTLAGDGASIRRRIHELGALGVNQVAVLPWLVPGQTLEEFVTMFADEVV